MRGKDQACSRWRYPDGITPACAGKSGSPGRPCSRGWDHPRVCGEKAASSYSMTCETGSPPRMRGKEQPTSSICSSAGITPACAGKRIERSQCRTSRRDHPRVCGEKVFASISILVAQGSPPRVRGKVRQHLESRQSVGITPACAGKRARPSPCRSQSRDHPRACGEKRVGSLASVGLSGSPPRVRGKAL